MRTTEIKLYSFDELNEEAKEVAIRECKDSAVESGTDADGSEIRGIVDEIENLAGVKCDIRDSSQGPYLWYAWQEEDDFELTDEEQFKRFQDKITNWNPDTAFGMAAKDIILKAAYDESRSYKNNVGWLLVEFWKYIDNEQLYYYEEEYIENFILANDFEFLEDGRLWTLNY